MNITVRPITEDEVPAFFEAMNLGFNTHPDPAEVERPRPWWILDRTFSAFDGDRVVGTARSFPTSLTLPGGGTVTAAAVTNVAVVPTHRRRGVLTAMMQRQLDDVVARGEPAAILIASEAPIYGRFGYGPATWVSSLKLARAHTRFAARPATADRVSLVDRERLRRVAPAVYDRHRVATPGSIQRSDRMWDARLGLTDDRPGDDRWKKQFHVVHDAGDGPDGWVTYRIDDDWAHRFPNNTAHIDDLVATAPEAYAALWFHVLSLDWMVTVIADDRPPIEPLPWLLTDPRQADVAHLSDLVWARLVDIPAALSARAYSGTGRLVLDVIDAVPPAGSVTAGRFALEASGDGSVCEPTGDDPDLTLSVAELGAAWLGGTPLAGPAGAGRVDEHTPGAVSRFDALFRWSPPPWCNTWF